MTLDEFALAATTSDLSREADARDVADLVEFRMDKATDPIDQLAAYDGELPILATNRNRWFGGTADDDGRLDTLVAASRFDDVALVDLELETARGTSWIVDDLRANDVDVVVSHHDFESTPDEEVLAAIVAECAEYGDVAKVATFPSDLSDTLTVLEVVRAATAAGRSVAGIAMGELGSHVRVIAHVYGSKLGYAPLVDDDADYAPGQIPLRQLAALIESTRVEDATFDAGDVPAVLDGTDAAPPERPRSD
ncbi:3-dehydroquinate dehydratase [Halopenitus malekzadehii]|uniref:3-dehydroquinate dehydratase n=1 Tax=Halopenitus malekzadehii TaxID=1267564 RepID=A0A1H6J6D4_9EURY|nr:3-dehydroquinate dehydratase [Halopenitus malekzadehii]